MAKKPANRASVTIIAGTLTVNGKTHHFQGVDYHRSEYPDGTVTERGRPAGLPPAATIGDIIRHAFGMPAEETPGPARKRKRKP